MCPQDRLQAVREPGAPAPGPPAPRRAPRWIARAVTAASVDELEDWALSFDHATRIQRLGLVLPADSRPPELTVKRPGERHHGVVALVTNRERTRFFIQQKDAAYPVFPLGYSLFGGAIEAGEEPEGALARELREELGTAAERLLGAQTRCVLAARTLATGVVLSLFEIVIEAAELEALPEVPVLEGLRGVVVDREALRGMQLVWGLHELVGAYLGGDALITDGFAARDQ